MNEFVHRTAGYSGSDVTQMCTELKEIVLRALTPQQIRKKKLKPSDVRRVSYTDLACVMNEYRSSVKLQEVELCNQFDGGSEITLPEIIRSVSDTIEAIDMGEGSDDRTDLTTAIPVEGVETEKKSPVVPCTPTIVDHQIKSIQGSDDCTDHTTAQAQIVELCFG